MHKLLYNEITTKLIVKTKLYIFENYICNYVNNNNKKYILKKIIN
uniref:Uncharacterized protein n=1 Tax=viral metagenome TaxID=1070528 RepID=A0A6C0H841_9ZZZZ